MIFGTRLSEAEVFSHLDLFTEMGGTLVDTADMYAYWLNQKPGEEGTGGCAEKVIGRWLRSSKKRSQIMLASKVGNPTSVEEERKGLPGLTAKRIITGCEGSLKRLGVETIDLYYAHTDDRRTPLEEIVEAFDRLVIAGKVRYLGASNWMSWRLAEARYIAENSGKSSFCCLQQKHSYLLPKPGQDLQGFQLVTEEVIDFCRRYGLSLVGHEPILKGTYVRPEEKLFDGRYDYETKDNRARLAALYQIAEEKHATAIQIVLAWMIQSDPPVIPLVAADNLEQLKEDLEAAQLQLDQEQLSRLNSAMA
jgi:aryl-alcohol dehydrogenase-like predicted oxidoreductase